MYRKGRRFEHKVKKYLENAGFTVFRCAGSKPIDLVAVRKNDNPVILLVECKTSCILPNQEKEKLVKIALRTGGIPIFAYPDGNSIILYDLIDNKYWRTPKVN